MALIKCTECGKQISSRTKKCPNCGCPVTIDRPKLKCPECGNELSEAETKCTNCGYPIAKKELIIETTLDEKQQVGFVLPDPSEEESPVNKFITKIFIIGGIIMFIYLFTHIPLFERKLEIEDGAGVYQCELNEIYRTATIVGYSGRYNNSIKVPSKIFWWNTTYKVTKIEPSVYAGYEEVHLPDIYNEEEKKRIKWEYDRGNGRKRMYFDSN